MTLFIILKDLLRLGFFLGPPNLIFGTGEPIRFISSIYFLLVVFVTTRFFETYDFLILFEQSRLLFVLKKNYCFT